MPNSDISSSDISSSDVAPNRAARRATQQEAFTLTLSVGGEYAGEQHWHTQPQYQTGPGHFVTRLETQFEGILPAVRQLQISQYGPDYQSLHFSEQEGGRGKPTFEVSACQQTGLLTLRQGRDEAVSALVAPHYDPVSLLMLLRSPQAPQEPWRASMTGGRVHVQPQPQGGAGAMLTAPGQAHGWLAATVRAYVLRPGGAWVVVEAQPPYLPLYLWQPTDFGAVEAHLEGARHLQEIPKSRRRVQPKG